MSGEKTEEATESKLDKSRKKGEVAKSQDLTMAVSMLGVFITLMAMGPRLWDHVRELIHLGLDFGYVGGDQTEIFKRMGAMAIEGLWVALPMAFAAMVFAIVGLAAHVGFLISMEAVAPKPEKVDPAAGLKRIFSAKSLISFVQMLVKAVVLGAVLWHITVSLLPLIAGSAYQTVEGVGLIAWSAVTKVLAIAVLLFLALGPLDFGLQRWLFLRDQRMSKDEVKREFKEQEGDPLIKSQRESLAEELANENPRARVASANAVIMNPTHYAVALRYRADAGGLPTIVAKGVDDSALRIRRMAEDMAVPVFVNPPLARALHQQPLDHPVPEELFEAVAAILRWVDQVGPAQVAARLD